MSGGVDEKVRRIASDVFNLPLADVKPDTSPLSVDNWDSVQQLNFVLALEESFGIQLEPEEVEQIRSVGGAMQILNSRQARY